MKQRIVVLAACLKYSDVTAKQIMITLSNGRKINVVAAGFVK
ncbi:MAG: hypothetical protein WC637_18235 [Victivallales bacterium]|jgi:hypothetical protein